MAHFLLLDEETDLPHLIPAVWVVAQAVDEKGDHWEVLNARGGIDDILLEGTKAQCRNFIKQVAALLNDGAAVIDPKDIDPDMEVLEMLDML